MEELKIDVEKIRKDIICEMIIDSLFNTLKQSSTKEDEIIISTYKIEEKQLTYLLEKYDKEKFEEYRKMLTNTNE